MKRVVSVAAVLGLTVFAVYGSGCYSPEHREHVAAARDDERRAAFDQCRADGRTDCDSILNAPVNSSAPASGDAVRERERHAAYERCVNEGGRDCSDLLTH
jgi:hypothetical protein